MTSDLQGVERAARLSLGNFEDAPPAPDGKARDLLRRLIVITAIGGALLALLLASFAA